MGLYFDCTGIMERTLYGKVFKVIKVEELSARGLQRLYIDICDLTITPEDCFLRGVFSSPMFELYEPEEQDEPLSENMMTFDEFFNGAIGGKENERRKPA